MWVWGSALIGAEPYFDLLADVGCGCSEGGCEEEETKEVVRQGCRRHVLRKASILQAYTSSVRRRGNKDDGVAARLLFKDPIVMAELDAWIHWPEL